MRQALKDLTFSEHNEWFGLGPLALVLLAGVRFRRALRARSIPAPTAVPPGWMPSCRTAR